MALPIIYEDNDVIAFNKPSGVTVHPARIAEKGIVGDGNTVVDWLRAHRPEVATVGDDPETRPGIVHRLDKETSGVLVAAKTQRAFSYLKSLFERHEVRKTYIALVHGAVGEKQGAIEKPIGLVNGTIRRTTRGGRMVKPAVTRYVRVSAAEGGGETYTLLEVFPETGRTHQIRVHLASIGHPVVGDPLYGKKREPPWAGRLALHARAVEFTAPDGKRLRLAIDPPPDFPRPPTYPQ